MAWTLLAGPMIGLVSAGYIRLIGWVSYHRARGTTGDDPELDTLLRLHTETACRRGGALALRLAESG